MKNFKPMTAAPKGALCHCKDRLGPHFLSLAEGGRVEDLSDEEYLERLSKLRPVSGGRRPERLNASRDVNLPFQLLRGWAAGTAGLPGDIEGIGRLLFQPSGVTLPGALGRAQRAMLPHMPDKESTLPTSDFYREWLPGYDAAPAARAASGLGSFAGGVGAGTAARGVRKGSSAVARGALGSVQRAMEGQGPLRGVLAPAAPMYAVKPRGGNVNDTSVDSLLTQMGYHKSDETQAWLKKNMRNYLKRDFGAPTDPLLALEKELPGLHIPEGAWPIGEDNVAHVYNNARIAGRRIEDSVPLPAEHWSREPPLVPPTSNVYDKFVRQLDRHAELSGGAPLTRWGLASDSNIMSGKAGEELAYELGEKWPIATMYPENGLSLEGLLKHTDNMIARWEMGARDNGLKAPAGDRYEKLKKYREMLAEKMATDWRAKQPDADVYQPLQAASGDLGFDHMTDYIEAATEPYRRLRQFVGESWAPEGETAADAAVRKAKDAKVYREFKDLFESGKSADELWDVHEFGYAPYRRQDFDRWVAMRDAGLLVDPESLPRMGVADVSRKTAAWNEFLANQGPSNEALQQGWKVFKEYGPEQGGMKWVEFGRGELPPGWSEKPDALGVVNLYDDAGEYVTQAGTHKDPRVSALRSGLGAEGDAMGHCVGGYCDDVLNRGTRIYSLRDAKGNPHVTIEVTPKAGWRDLRSLRDDPNLVRLRDVIDDEQLQAIVNSQHEAGLPVSAEARLDQLRALDYYYHPGMSQWISPEHLVDPVSDIVQIKGKGNAAPVDKYLPMVQDFVRSGKWGRVGDLGNTGLRRAKDVFGSVMPEGLTPEQYITLEDALRVSDPRDHEIYRGAWEGHKRGYAHGGSVQPADDAPKGFLPRSFEEWVEYAEHLYRTPAHTN